MSTPNQFLTPLEHVIAPARHVIDSLWGTIVTHFRGREGPARVVFLGAEEGVGTTTIAASTALGLVHHAHERLHYVELDIEHPTACAYLGMSHTRGLSDVLDRKVSVEECLVEMPAARGLFVCSAGTERSAVSGELSTEHAREVWRRAGERARYVFFDAPPVLMRPELRLLLDEADAAVLVVRSGATAKRAAERSAEVLASSGVTVLGTVLNAYVPDMPFASRR